MFIRLLGCAGRACRLFCLLIAKRPPSDTGSVQRPKRFVCPRILPERFDVEPHTKQGSFSIFGDHRQAILDQHPAKRVQRTKIGLPILAARRSLGSQFAHALRILHRLTFVRLLRALSMGRRSSYCTRFGSRGSPLNQATRAQHITGSSSNTTKLYRCNAAQSVFKGCRSWPREETSAASSHMLLRAGAGLDGRVIAVFPLHAVCSMPIQTQHLKSVIRSKQRA